MVCCLKFEFGPMMANKETCCFFIIICLLVSKVHSSNMKALTPLYGRDRQVTITWEIITEPLTFLVQGTAMKFYGEAIFVGGNFEGRDIMVSSLKEYYEQRHRKVTYTVTITPHLHDNSSIETNFEEVFGDDDRVIITSASIGGAAVVVLIVAVFIYMKKRQRNIRESIHVLHKTIKMKDEDYTDIISSKVKESMYTSLNKIDPWVEWPQLQNTLTETENIFDGDSGDYKELDFSERNKTSETEDDYVTIEEDSRYSIGDVNAKKKGISYRVHNNGDMNAKKVKTKYNGEKRSKVSNRKSSKSKVQTDQSKIAGSEKGLKSTKTSLITNHENDESEDNKRKEEPDCLYGKQNSIEEKDIYIDLIE